MVGEMEGEQKGVTGGKKELVIGTVALGESAQRHFI